MAGDDNPDPSGKQKPPPKESRFRNPLNVVVEKIGATRALVHGDLSKESLKELLMSSLSLVPGSGPIKWRTDDAPKKMETFLQTTDLTGAENPEFHRSVIKETPQQHLEETPQLTSDERQSPERGEEQEDSKKNGVEGEEDEVMMEKKLSSVKEVQGKQQKVEDRTGSERKVPYGEDKIGRGKEIQGKEIEKKKVEDKISIEEGVQDANVKKEEIQDRIYREKDVQEVKINKELVKDMIDRGEGERREKVEQNLSQMKEFHKDMNEETFEGKMDRKDGVEEDKVRKEEVEQETQRELLKHKVKKHGENNYDINESGEINNKSNKNDSESEREKKRMRKIFSSMREMEETGDKWARVEDNGEEKFEKEKIGEKDEGESLVTCDSSGADNMRMSYDGEWLRQHFKKPLVLGMRSIVAKKPRDPVEYLAFWLLEYKSLQEKAQQEREWKDELLVLRSKVPVSPVPETEDEEFPYGGGEGEGQADFNFRNYGAQ